MTGRRASRIRANTVKFIAVVASASVLMLAAVAVLAGLSRELTAVLVAGIATAVGITSAATLGKRPWQS